MILAFLADRTGATAIEFGFLGIPFIGLLFALFQTGLVFFTSETLEAATQDAARKIYTGTAQAAGISTSSAFVQSYLCPATGTRLLPSYVDCSKIFVDVRPASSFTNADLEPDFYQSNSSVKFCPGGPGDPSNPGNIVVVRILYPMPVLLPIVVGTTTKTIGQVRTGLVNDVPDNPGWKQLLIGTAVFVNEPFDATSYTPPPGC